MSKLWLGAAGNGKLRGQGTLQTCKLIDCHVGLKVALYVSQTNSGQTKGFFMGQAFETSEGNELQQAGKKQPRSSQVETEFRTWQTNTRGGETGVLCNIVVSP